MNDKLTRNVVRRERPDAARERCYLPHGMLLEKHPAYAIAFAAKEVALQDGRQVDRSTARAGTPLQSVGAHEATDVNFAEKSVDGGISRHGAVLPRLHRALRYVDGVVGRVVAALRAYHMAYRSRSSCGAQVSRPRRRGAGFAATGGSTTFQALGIDPRELSGAAREKARPLPGLTP